MHRSSIVVNTSHGFKSSLWVLLGALFFSGVVMAIEEPRFEVLIEDKPFELRHYAGFTVAETEVQGDFDAASRTGFRRVANFIFGNNAMPDGESKKIAMTAPVTVEPQADGSWRLHFVMPSQETPQTLPRPNRPEVGLRQVEPHAMAAIRFSGWTTQSSIEEQTQKLKAWMLSKNLPELGTPQVARYDDPFTLPWRRRNEILIPTRP